MSGLSDIPFRPHAVMLSTSEEEHPGDCRLCAQSLGTAVLPGRLGHYGPLVPSLVSVFGDLRDRRGNKPYLDANVRVMGLPSKKSSCRMKRFRRYVHEENEHTDGTPLAEWLLRRTSARDQSGPATLSRSPQGAPASGWRSGGLHPDALGRPW